MNSKAQTIYIVLILLLIGAIGVVYYHYHQKVAILTAMVIEADNKQANNPRLGNNGGSGSQSGMPMTQSSPPPVSDQQTSQLTLGTDTTVTKKTFNITGGNFYFVPNQITVNKGDEVTFVMTNAGGVHNLVIDELNVKASTIKSGETESVTFTATKTGSFVYYCAIPGHREKGMFGTLVVQ